MPHREAHPRSRGRRSFDGRRRPLRHCHCRRCCCCGAKCRACDLRPSPRCERASPTDASHRSTSALSPKHAPRTHVGGFVPRGLKPNTSEAAEPVESPVDEEENVVAHSTKGNACHIRSSAYCMLFGQDYIANPRARPEKDKLSKFSVPSLLVKRHYMLMARTRRHSVHSSVFLFDDSNFFRSVAPWVCTVCSRVQTEVWLGCDGCSCRRPPCAR